ncbi:PFE-CTERM domain-containing protein [Roseofilum casamattae]|uniref:PEP-CTERM sorting domain-containing protein n=1 Tax=Roseofilum casamattae BLCC-M143 TaxID=3022442 RepID=A0ABT7BYN2_9CYAN|nr:hypothetical protein [Roseofilum casamattae]MDJ1183561.1 hypothetical protein [Roseofilum casamattae BLCC-M143]
MKINPVIVAIIATLGTVLAAGTARAASVTLYNGSGLPSSQGQLTLGAIDSGGANLTPFGGETVVGGGVQIDSDVGSAEYAGYSNYNPLTSSFVNSGGSAPSGYSLDPTTGYSIFFNATLNSTTSNSNDRGAFTVIATSVGQQSIEISFENNLVFAQNNNFTRGESAAFTTSTNANYELRVSGSSYQFFANSSQLLSGSLRNYLSDPANSMPPLSFDAYTIENFIFFGDSTGQEDGVYTLGAASVQTNTAGVPFEFPAWTGILMMGIGTVVYQFRRQKK